MNKIHAITMRAIAWTTALVSLGAGAWIFLEIFATYAEATSAGLSFFDRPWQVIPMILAIFIICISLALLTAVSIAELFWAKGRESLRR